MELLIILLLSLSLFFLLKWRNYHARKLHRRPPGPRGLPLIGKMHQFDSSNTHLYLLQLSKIYGPLVHLQLGSVPVLVISSASAAKEIFKYHDHCFSSRPALVGAQKLSYNGLDLAFAPYNDYWKNTRKLCTLHLFSSKRAQSFRPLREEEVARMVKTIHDKANTSAESNIVNLSKTNRFWENNGMSTRIHWVLNATQASFASFFLADYFPLWGSLLDRLGGARARLDKNFDELNVFYHQLIDEHMHASTASAQECSILDILLQMNKDSSGITFDHIKAILMNVIVAGTGSSAEVVAWAMTLLIKNPTTMNKAQQEVRELTGKKGFIDESNLQKLVYLKAIVKEAIRLHPPAPLLVPRETTEKCVVSGYQIEAKTRVYINAYAIGRDPESWENPDEFSPERFIDSTIDFKGQDFELIPFGAGRRMCPGISMGVATTELVLANLLYSFDWELHPGKRAEDIDMATLPGITTHKKNDLCLVPKAIN
ncbi:hypothetical protein DCAR_0519140 [Daucus carota subsp. sativus]|uniref:Cytochrome P450 n=1 Tax=Daucus carota subsp. sativus TaxID=79200 RepID=A0AAF0X272_DAUCS|nr:hypothetical protein DCAR_0519140 [Daucus carota subsp. sativus]